MCTVHAELGHRALKRMSCLSRARQHAHLDKQGFESWQSATRVSDCKTHSVRLQAERLCNWPGVKWQQLEMLSKCILSRLTFSLIPPPLY